MDSDFDGYFLKDFTEISRKSMQLEIVNQITRCITIDMSFAEMMDSIHDNLHEFIDHDLLSFCIIEHQRNLIIKTGVPKQIKGLSEGQILKGHNENPSMPWQVIKNKQYIIREDILNDSELYAEDQALIDFDIQSVVVVPLIVKNKVTGTFNLGSKRKYAFDSQDAEFLQQIAEHLAVSFENARLYLEESTIKNELEETFRSITDIIYVVDANFTLLRFNEYTREFGKSIGVNLEEGRKCYQFFSESGEKCESCPAKEVIQSGGAVKKRSYSRFGRIWDGFAYPVYSRDGQFNRVIILIKDVTKRIEIESQLIQSAKMADMGIITAGIAHEINSPLTAVIGNALLLEQQKSSFTEAQLELINDIKQCGLRCKEIIQTVKSFARKDDQVWEAVDINNISTDALKLVSYQLHQKNIHLLTDFSPGIPMVMADRQQMEQVVVNLLLNATDALRDQARPCIEISTGYDTGTKQVFVSISDNGCGMYPEEMANIFNTFYTTKQVQEGIGLGLSISKRIVDEHKGIIEVSSKQGVGSRFTILLPERQGGDLNAR